jgi:hypothetical protein
MPLVSQQHNGPPTRGLKPRQRHGALGELDGDDLPAKRALLIDPSLLIGADPVNVGPALGAQGVPVRECSPVVRRVRNRDTRSDGIARPEQGAEVRLERDPQRGNDEMVPASMATPTSSTADVAAPRLLGAQAPGAAALSSRTPTSLTQRFRWNALALASLAETMTVSRMPSGHPPWLSAAFGPRVWATNRTHAACLAAPTCAFAGHSAAGATGLEPATSGVTGHAGDRDAGGGKARIALNGSTLRAVWAGVRECPSSVIPGTFGPRLGQDAWFTRCLDPVGRLPSRSGGGKPLGGPCGAPGLAPDAVETAAPRRIL